MKYFYDGFAVPDIGFGVYQTPASECARAVEEALEVGYRLIDSARAYGNEREAAQGIASFLKKHPHVGRKDIIYTSKIYCGHEGMDEQEVIDIAKESWTKVEDLIGHIDIYLIHSSHGGPAKREAEWRGLSTAVDMGWIKYIGVSNYGVKHLEELESARIRPCLNQIELNPWLQRRDIVDYCHAHGIVVEAYSPLTRGKRFDHTEIPPLAKKYGKTPAQILLRWAVQYNVIPLPKSTHLERIKENFDIFDFELTEDEVQKEIGDPKGYDYVAWDPTVLP